MQLGLFLVPTALYGLWFMGQHFPKSEASEKGLSVGEMFHDVGILGALVACFLLGLFFKDQLGGMLGFFTAIRSSRPRPGACSPGRSRSVCCSSSA